jgi:hypothetical protein
LSFTCSSFQSICLDSPAKRVLTMQPLTRTHHIEQFYIIERHGYMDAKVLLFCSFMIGYTIIESNLTRRSTCTNLGSISRMAQWRREGFCAAPLSSPVEEHVGRGFTPLLCRPPFPPICRYLPCLAFCLARRLIQGARPDGRGKRSGVKPLQYAAT